MTHQVGTIFKALASALKRLRAVLLGLGAVAVLSTCGIPNYFYLGYNYINITTYSQSATEQSYPTANVSFRVTDPKQLQKCRYCPSVCLFYFLDNGSLYQNNKSKIISDFSSKFGAESNKGSLFNAENGVISGVIDKFSPSDDSSVSISVYPLGFANGRVAQRPLYHVSMPVDAEGKPLTDTIKFQISYDAANCRLVLRYPMNPGDGEDIWFEEELARAGGEKSFLDIRNATDFASYKRDNPDLDAVKDSKLIKINIMAALCASQGTFDNIYWSRLSDLDNVAVFDL